MASWRNIDLLTLQSFGEAIFNCKHIKCETIFYWIPHLDQWIGSFKTEYKYLNIHEKRELQRDFSNEYDGFVGLIESIRDSVAREYNYYFNALWC
jgi:hypothetical protein